MRHLASLLAFVFSLFLFTNAAHAAGPSQVAQYHATVGTTTAAAVPGADVKKGLAGWRICADSSNGNTLTVGQATDAATDGTVLAAGACFVCDACTSSTLTPMKVKGGAASMGYSVVQFK